MPLLEFPLVKMGLFDQLGELLLRELRVSGAIAVSDGCIDLRSEYFKEL